MQIQNERKDDDDNSSYYVFAINIQICFVVNKIITPFRYFKRKRRTTTATLSFDITHVNNGKCINITFNFFSTNDVS